jgi:FeoA domain.
MSETVASRLLEYLNSPRGSPFGNAIPGLVELLPGRVDSDGAAAGADELRHLDVVASPEWTTWTVRRIAEPVQFDTELMGALQAAGIGPGADVGVTREGGGVILRRDSGEVRVPDSAAAHIVVSPV